MSDKILFQKILTLAVNPSALEGEAQAAFGKLRELARQNPHLATLPTPPPMPPPVTRHPEDTTSQWRLVKIPPYWLSITVDNLSGQSYNLGLRSRFSFDFLETPTALEITCTGSKESCDCFGQALAFLINYINSQPPIQASPS